MSQLESDIIILNYTQEINFISNVNNEKKCNVLTTEREKKALCHDSQTK